MNTQFNRIVDPIDYAVSLPEVQDYLKIDYNTDDTEIQYLIEAAINDAETYMRRALLTATYQAVSDDMHECFPLRFGPIQEITSIKYINLDGDTRTIAPESYYLTRKNLNGMIVFVDDFELPTDVRKFEGWIVEYIAGYGKPDEVPSIIRNALKICIATAYEFREESVGIPEEAKRIYDKYKIRTL